MKQEQWWLEQIQIIHEQLAALRRYTSQLLMQVKPASNQALTSHINEAYDAIAAALERLQVFQEETVTNFESILVLQENLPKQNEQLAAQQHRYYDLFIAAPNGYLLTDAQGFILEANCMAAKLLNVQRPFLLGQSLVDFTVEQERQTFRSWLAKLNQPDLVQEWEVCLQPLQGELFRAALTVAARYEASSVQLTLHICMRKIAPNQLVETEQDQLLTLEQTARAQAQSANYRSNQLLKIANNEFRTALELIQAWTQQLQNGQLDAVATAWAVRSIERQVKLLLQLIEDLQDVSEMISHNQALQTSQIDLLMQQMERQMAAANTSFDSTPLTATAPEPVLDGLQVLLIDDEADARELIAAVLEQYGISVIAATSVAEALAVLKRSRPDVLISDIRMPDEDGYALIRKVRMLEALKGWHIPAIALTAYLDEERASALAAGFQLHLHKFTPPTQLVAMVAQLAGQA